MERISVIQSQPKRISLTSRQFIFSEYDSRNKYYQTKQKEWADQQQYERWLREERERQEEAEYAKQTKEITRMR